jgi:hypothetical protein
MTINPAQRDQSRPTRGHATQFLISGGIVGLAIGLIVGIVIGMSLRRQNDNTVTGSSGKARTPSEVVKFFFQAANVGNYSQAEACLE